ncbi:MGH1-like glycoside hydrolase domain-containing protein, partial [Streptomyces avermitilis]
GLFLVRDLVDDRLIPELSVAGLIPLLVPGLPDHIIERLTHTLNGAHFHAKSTVLVPSYDLSGRAFDSTRYWRGPAWFNTAWLIERGLRAHGRDTQADRLRDAFLTTAGNSQFAEYVDSTTGDGRGTRNFSWTAALTLDLLCADDKEPPL